MTVRGGFGSCRGKRIYKRASSEPARSVPNPIVASWITLNSPLWKSEGFLGNEHTADVSLWWQLRRGHDSGDV